MTLFGELERQQDKNSASPEMTTQQEQVDGQTIAPVLQTVMQNGLNEGRLTCGIAESANVLESYPDSVFLCVLNASITDVTQHILATLIEAFCAENCIPLLKVADGLNLDKMGKSTKRTTTSVDFGTNCFLLQFPENCHLSQKEEILLKYYRQTYNVFPQPVITITR